MAGESAFSQEETLAIPAETGLWHIAMPVVGAVHSIISGLKNVCEKSEIFQNRLTG